MLFKTFGASIPILLATLLLLYGYALALPRYYNGRAEFEGKHTQFDAPDLGETSHGVFASADFDVFIPSLHASTYRIYSNTISDVYVNGREVQTFNDSRARVKRVQLAHALAPGLNRIRLQFADVLFWLGFYWMPEVTDAMTMSLIALITTVAFLSLRHLWALSPEKLEPSECAIFVVGAFLRVMYCLATPFFVRGYDVDWGHMPYLFYSLKELRLPTNVQITHEWFQPPLYYVLSVVSALPLRALSVCRDTLIHFWQMEACLLSLASLGACIPISRLLFRKQEVWKRHFFLACAGFLPSMFFNFSGINNDVLFSTLTVFWLWSMLSIWKRISFIKWIVLSLILAAALLTKLNALLLIAASFTLLALSNQISKTARGYLLVISSTILFVSSAWFYVPRALSFGFAMDENFTGANHLNKSLRITEGLDKLFTFDPVQVLSNPFCNETDDPRRSYFPEFFFRSSFFGGDFFPNGVGLTGVIAHLIIGFALLCLPFIMVGFFRANNIAGTNLPMIVTMLLGVAGHILFRLKEPFICSQAFRYSFYLIFPLTYFCLQGIDVRSRPLRVLGKIVLAALLAGCAAFIVNLSLDPQ